MGIFDKVFKKKSTDELNNTQQPVSQSVVSPLSVIEQTGEVKESLEAKSLIPEAEEISAGQKEIASIVEIASVSVLANKEGPIAEEKKPLVRWPINGTTAWWLCSSNFMICADSKFVQSPGTDVFISEWRKAAQEKKSNKRIFILQFEVDKLSETDREKMNNWPDVFSLRAKQNNYNELFSAIKGLSWNIVFLSVPDPENADVKRAATESGISLRLYNVGSNGKLYSMPGIQNASSLRCQNSQQGTPNRINAFDTPMQMAIVYRASHIPSSIPAVGSVVISDEGKSFTLGKPIMSNAISITYSTNQPDYYAKIYTREALQITYTEQKCRLMLTRRIQIPGVCWPVSILNSMDGCFVGIVVPKSSGFQLRKALLKESLVLQYFNGWNKQDMVILLENILKTIEQLQHWHVYFGVLNLAAIYIQDKANIYFTDLDSWQIEGYPSLDDNKMVLPPELQDLDTRLHFYNQDELNYQIAYLSFMLMMPGRLPYAQRFGNSSKENIIRQEFSFGVGRFLQSTGRSAPGFWRFVWDHISYSLAADFNKTFARGGEYSKPGTRRSVGSWLRDVEDYENKLDAPIDPEDLKLYPSTFRKDGIRQFRRCAFCGNEHPDFFFVKTMKIKEEPTPVSIANYNICGICYHGPSDADFVCKGCGEHFSYTNAAKIKHEFMQKYHGYVDPQWCPNCKETYEERTCIDCGKNFIFTVGQQRYYEKMGFLPPRRCPDCAKKKKKTWK